MRASAELHSHELTRAGERRKLSLCVCTERRVAAGTGCGGLCMGDVLHVDTGGDAGRIPVGGNALAGQSASPRRHCLVARYEAQAALGYTACDATRVRDACTNGTAACIFSYDMVPYVVAMYDDDGRMCGTGTVVRSGDGDDWLVLTSSAAVGGGGGRGGGGSVRFFVEQGVAACDHIEMKLDDGAVYRFGPEAVMVR